MKVYLGTLSQALVVGAVLTSPLAVSLYEFRSKRKVEARIFALRGSSTFKALLITLAGLTDSNLPVAMIELLPESPPLGLATTVVSAVYFAVLLMLEKLMLLDLDC